MAFRSTSLLSGVAFAVSIWSSPAQAQCSTSTAPGGPTVYNCDFDTATTPTTNTDPNNPATYDRTQSVGNTIVGRVNQGVTVSGRGIHIFATGAEAISFENRGTIIGGPGVDFEEPIAQSGAALRLEGFGGPITYTGNGSVSTTPDALYGLLIRTGNGGGVQVGSAAAPITGNFTGGYPFAVEDRLQFLPGNPNQVGTTDTGDVNVFFSGGTFTKLPQGFVAGAIRIFARGGSVNLDMTGGSIITGTPESTGIQVLTRRSDAPVAPNISISTDALIGSASAPLREGITAINGMSFGGERDATPVTGGTTVALTGAASIDATFRGILARGEGIGPVRVTTAPDTVVRIAPAAGQTSSLGIVAVSVGPGDVSVDLGGRVIGAQTGLLASAVNGSIDVAIQPGALVSGSVLGLEIRRVGTGSTNVLVLGTLSSPATAAQFTGTLQVGNGGTTGTIAGNVVNDGVLIFNRSDAVTYGDVVSGTGSLTQAGAGLLTLTGANTYTGGTTISAGTLQIGNGGTTGSIVGNVANSGTLAFNRSDAITYAGVVSGSGNLIKTGAGTLTLSGTNTYTGATSVQQGMLLVTGATAGTTTVNAGATLGGTGRIGSGSFAGTVAPGTNGVGTLSATGNVTFAAGSTFQVQVNPDASSDRLVVGGTAILQGGTVQSLFLGSEDNRCGAAIQSTILTAGGGVSGTFSGVTSNFAFLTPSLSYDSNNVFLTLTRNAATFAERGATDNQRASAAAAEALKCGNALFNPLVQLSAADARTAFEQISGEIHAGTRGALLDDSRFIRDALTSARIGGGGFWASGYGSWGEIEGDGNAAALDRESTGFFGGADLPLAPGLGAGVALGRSRAQFGLDARNSDSEVRSWHAAARVAGSLGGVRVVAGGAMSWHRIDTSRSIAFTGFSDSPSASYDGRTRQLFAEIGYELPFGAASIEPFAGAARVDVDTDGFTEAGGAAALTGEDGSSKATFTTLGLRARVGAGPVSLTGSAAWRHASGVERGESRLAFGPAGQSFTVTGASVAEDALMIEAGAGIGIGGAGRLRIVYSGQLAGETNDHGGRATLSLPF
jgi:outer membrane autotransporter protein